MGSRPSLCKGVPEWPAGICQEGQCPRQNKDHAQIGGDRLMGEDRLMGRGREWDPDSARRVGGCSRAEPGRAW